ncbi:hypothetical protein RD792_012882 [Penstemon davidsonii]|uniref:RING-type E3 ubiquitin transferase n=1 Tax=Penstemon davidsonii TaxID=160366 RepID=A0ABR0CY44_9LAMI|nr:hypothetical protein RD792_012882 [Penstemon davidsonii]
MSFHDRAAAALLAQLSLAADGAVLGFGVAYVAYRCIRKLTSTSSALRKIRDAPYVQPSDLRSLLKEDNDSSHIDGGKLVFVRGSVDVNYAAQVKGNWTGLRSNNGNNVLISHESGDKGVILQRTQTVPFILVEVGKWPQSDYVIVNMEGSTHPLPLTTVYHHLQPINASPYTFIQAFFGLEYPIGLLDEEKMLPLGKDITAVGICNLRNGIPEIKSCKDLPYFLSDLSKDQIIADLSFKTKVLMWSGIFVGSVAIGILGYSIARNWNRWKEWRQQQQAQQQNDSASSETSAEVGVDEEPGEVPDGDLCVICLMRMRRSAFIPCGHLVCCQRCALSVEREVSPKCPVCRQSIRSSVRIYDS